MSILHFVFSSQHNKQSLANASHIWTARFSQKLEQLDACYALLSTDEQQRASRYIKQEDQHKAILGLAWRRIILAHYLKTNPDSLIFNYSDRGKPEIDQIHFSVSHSGDYWAIAVSLQPIGLDLETPRDSLDPLELAKRFFTTHEVEQIENSLDTKQSFLQIWTTKEAYLKALGKGITDGLDQFDVTLLNDNKRQLTDPQYKAETLHLWPDVSDALVCDMHIKEIEKVYF